MNLLDIINEELDSDTEYTLEEGLFEVSPMIALFAFKDDLLNKGKTFAKKITSPVTNVIGKGVAGAEKMKAKTLGQSGFKDDDTVYKFSKKQKEVMAYLYKKYGPDMVNKITDFRKEVLAPYQVIKRSIAKNHSLTNKEVYGMTKEEYYKYRESGRKKIEAKGTFFKDSKELRDSTNISRESLNRAKKVLQDFKEGKVIDLSSTNMERILDDAGLGRNKLYGWSESELEKTATKIREIEGWLADPKRLDENGNVRVSYGRNDRRASKENKTVLEAQLKALYEHGISYTNNKRDDEGRKNKGPFKEAFATYLLRREQIKNMKSSMSNSRFNSYYKKVLEDAVNSADRIYKEKINNFTSLKSKSELNKMEKKIWGLKLTGVKYSGRIEDWYLKIKPEDFMDNTKYYDKPKSVIEAEKEMDKILKQFERDLKKEMTPEDLALCKKYRLFNNLLTVKQFKNADAMFKGEKDLEELKDTIRDPKEIEDKIISAMNKEYNSIKDLEDAQKHIKKMVSGVKLPSDVKSDYDKFMKRVDPKNYSESTKLDRKKIDDIIIRINDTEYEGITQANEDLDDLEKAEREIQKKYGETELKKYKYDIQQAKDKINGFLQGRED